jgi:hypothetical protein
LSTYPISHLPSRSVCQRLLFGLAPIRGPSVASSRIAVRRTAIHLLARLAVAVTCTSSTAAFDTTHIPRMTGEIVSRRHSLESTRSIVGAPGYAAAVSAAAGRTFGPIDAISYQFGSKRAVGYFDTSNGKCQITLMVAEAIDPEVARPVSAARLLFSIWPGESAGLASEEGPSMELTCGAGAQTVVVKCNPSCGGRP